MIDYLVFDEEEQAHQVERAIFNFGLSLAEKQGYLIDEKGIHSKVNGSSNSNTISTNKWDIPKRRNDGKWIIVHPKHHPASKNDIAFEMMKNILDNVSIEVGQSNWFQ